MPPDAPVAGWPQDEPQFLVRFLIRPLLSKAFRDFVISWPGAMG
jgi:hypothetical protein